MKDSTVRKLHNFFEWLSTGGLSCLIERESELPPLPADDHYRRMVKAFVNDLSTEIEGVEVGVQTMRDPSYEPSIIAPPLVDSGVRILTVTYKKKKQ